MLGRSLLLAALLHVWLVLWVGTQPGSGLPGGQGGGRLLIELRGPAGAAPPSDAPSPALDAGRDAQTSRGPGRLRKAVPPPQAGPGAEAKGRWRSQPVAPAPDRPEHERAGAAEDGLSDQAAARAAPTEPAAPPRPTLTEATAVPRPPAIDPVQALRSPALAELRAAPPQIALPDLAQPDPQPTLRTLTPAPRRVPPRPAEAALAPPPELLPDRLTALPTAAPPTLRTLDAPPRPAPLTRPDTLRPLAPAAAATATALSPLPAQALAATPGEPVAAEAPARVRALDAVAVPRDTLARTARLASIGGGSASAAPPPAALTALPSRAVGDAPSTDAEASPGARAAAGAPDEGARVGHDVPVPPSAAASRAPPAPLDLRLPRQANGPRAHGPGLLALLPAPPERKSKLQEGVEAASREDCQTAHAGKGLLAVVPLVVDAVRDKGCKW